jgi:hypothetical protein
VAAIFAAPGEIRKLHSWRLTQGTNKRQMKAGAGKLIFGETTKKREVLALIGERSLERKPTSYRTLAREFLISSDAACAHLKRLWRERLIRSTEFPSNYSDLSRERPSIRELQFLISRRGVYRLAAWKRREKSEDWL